ncbi:hypothetical protein MKX47_21010 [Solibacillus sp. FSL R7-0668]|uniref:hypothetical protein n=1 Tax=Solibacillus sp. FSL R7-0668 TaxID=2921688 RepID=UPI0030FAE590
MVEKSITIPVTQSNSYDNTEPMAREKIEIPICTGDGYGRISVYKDDFFKEIRKNAGIGIYHDFTK